MARTQVLSLIQSRASCKSKLLASPELSRDPRPGTLVLPGLGVNALCTMEDGTAPSSSQGRMSDLPQACCAEGQTIFCIYTQTQKTSASQPSRCCDPLTHAAPRAVVTPNHKLLLLLLHNCDFTIMNLNVTIFLEIDIFQEVMTHRLRTAAVAAM